MTLDDTPQFCINLGTDLIGLFLEGKENSINELLLQPRVNVCSSQIRQNLYMNTHA